MPSRPSIRPGLRMVEASCGRTSELHGLPDGSPGDNSRGGVHPAMDGSRSPRMLDSTPTPRRPHRTLCDPSERPARANHINGPPCGPKEKAMKKHSRAWITKAAALAAVARGLGGGPSRPARGGAVPTLDLYTSSGYAGQGDSAPWRRAA